MDSKKKLQFIRDTYEFYFDRSKPFKDTELTEQEKEAFDSIKKDLEELEELKKIMGTPIQDIMKKLRKLEVIETHYAYDDKECRFNLIKPISIEDDEILKEMVK